MSARTRGRGASYNTPNRFERSRREPLELDITPDEECTIPTRYYRDSSRSILARNDSPDIPFTFSLNPYRGCEHGCIYCYARPSHEYLGFSAGIDFESRIMVKLRAPELLAAALSRKSWVPQMVALSGNTDCYQPVERTLLLTRKCLEVFLEFRNPVSLVTKNALLLRDLDLMRAMARLHLIHVMISITTLDQDLQKVMEPRASTPALRLQAIEHLAREGIPVGVNAAPIIPGLTDEEIPSILREAAARGARSAGTTILRLPGAVEPLFLDWLKRTLPGRASKVVNRIKETRAGALSDHRFGSRMEGEGMVAEAINALFTLTAARHGLAARWEELSTAHFRRRGGDLFGN